MTWTISRQSAHTLSLVICSLTPSTGRKKNSVHCKPQGSVEFPGIQSEMWSAKKIFFYIYFIWNQRKTNNNLCKSTTGTARKKLARAWNSTGTWESQMTNYRGFNHLKDITLLKHKGQHVSYVFLDSLLLIEEWLLQLPVQNWWKGPVPQSSQIAN